MSGNNYGEPGVPPYEHCRIYNGLLDIKRTQYIYSLYLLMIIHSTPLEEQRWVMDNISDITLNNGLLHIDIALMYILIIPSHKMMFKQTF